MLLLLLLLPLKTDDIMKARAKSNVEDRTIGTRTARSKAAKNARRGMTSNKEPSAQQIAQEVHKQTLQTTVKTNAKNIMNLVSNRRSSSSRNRTSRNGGSMEGGVESVGNTNHPTTKPPTASSTRKDRVSLRQQQREMNTAAKQLAVVNSKKNTSSQSAHSSSFVGTPDHIPIPTRSMIQAAKTAMIQAGYIFPDRTTLHVVPVPSQQRGHPTTAATVTTSTQNHHDGTTTPAMGRGGGRRTGGGGGGGRTTSHNNNNNNNGRMRMN